MPANSRPIVVIKKKGGHGGHHGGAWKVAYADFVTAMMALFIVLWLMNSSENVKKAVAGYFNDPKGTANLLGTTMTGNGVATVENKDALDKLKTKLEQQIRDKQDLQKLSKQIEITIVPEGLRIELIEDKNGTFYELGSPRLSPSGQELLALLAGELKTLPNDLLIEGHTDATQYSSDTSYSNWELSADRANTARRLMQADGVRPDQVTQVRGYADQLLRVKNNPYDPSNRRISILVHNASQSIPGLKGAQTAGGADPSAADAGKKAATEPLKNANAPQPPNASSPSTLAMASKTPAPSGPASRRRTPPSLRKR